MVEPYKIIEVPDPVLRQIAQPVQTVNEALRTQIERMTETMYEKEGIGIAANQVNLLNRVIVVDTARRESGIRTPIGMINPEIIWSSDELFTWKEGCLSIPNQYADVERPKMIRVKYIDTAGKEQEAEFKNLASTCVQHEIDHLDGKLFIDYISKLKRDMLLKRLDKERKEAGTVL